MVVLCESMINLHKKSSSVFADINKSIWERKLKYWKLNEEKNVL